MHQPTFKRTCYTQFKNKKVFCGDYIDDVEQDAEHIIKFLQEEYSRVEHGLFGGVARVLVVEK